MLHCKPTYFLGTFIIACVFISCTSASNNTPATVSIPVIEPSYNPYAAVDKSPLDISYYPVNYPTELMAGRDSSGLVARVIYSRPQKNGRTIFGSEAPPKCVQQYGAYWRLGANEATEIEFFKPVTIQDKKMPKGRYIIYCIPYENKWTIVFNTNLFSWGLHTDTTKDVAKIEIPIVKTVKSVEYFSMVFQQTPVGADLVMAWDNVKANLSLQFK